jgi:hypothetical protein
VIKGSKMKVVEHIACREGLGKEYSTVLRDMKEGHHIGNLDASGRLIET